MTATKIHKIDEISEKLAEQFIKALSENKLPWQKDWDIYCIDPHNPATGTVYAGTSRYILMCEQNEKGYSDPRWLTFNNGKDLGANVRKGEKGTTCIRFQPKKIAKLDENEKPVLNEKGEVKTKEILMPIPYVVFNAAQFNDLKLPPIESLEQKHNWSLDERAENILKTSGATIDISQRNEAFYRPSEDKIYLPLREQFKSSEGFYKTALHELAHWTGHESRLNRKNINAFGTPSYAREELRAEIAASIISVKLGINTDITNNKAYIQGWIKTLKDEPREILSATRDADKISKYVLQFDLVKAKVPEPLVKYKDQPNKINEELKKAAVANLQENMQAVQQVHNKEVRRTIDR